MVITVANNLMARIKTRRFFQCVKIKIKLEVPEERKWLVTPHTLGAGRSLRYLISLRMIFIGLSAVHQV